MNDLTQFQKDLETEENFNGCSKGIYNLLTTKRDMHLYCVGIIPNKCFRINQVKKYFGLKGDKFKINEQIIDMVNRAILGEYKQQSILKQ